MSKNRHSKGGKHKDGIGGRLDPMWMELVQAKNQNGTPEKKIPLSEVQRHNKDTDLWLVLGDKIYDCTTFRTFHPGGADTLVRCAGGDGTRLFTSIHPWVSIQAILGPYCVGSLCDESEVKNTSTVGSDEQNEDLEAAWEVLKEKGEGTVTIKHVRDMLLELEMEVTSIDKIKDLKEPPETEVTFEAFRTIFNKL